MSADPDRTLDLDRLVTDARTIARGPARPMWRIRDTLTDLADLIERHAKQAAADKYALDAIAVVLQQPAGNHEGHVARVAELVAATGRELTATSPPLYWPRVAHATGVVHLETDDGGVSLCGAHTDQLVGLGKATLDELRQRTGRGLCATCGRRAVLPTG